MQVAVADLAAAQAACGLGLARREGREVIVQHELLGTLYQHFVLDFFVEFRTERNAGSDCVSPRVKIAEPWAAGR